MEIGLEKLFLFPDKLKKMLEVWESKEIDNTFPLNVELSLTNRCNFNCVWCSDKGIRQAFGGDLDKDIIFKLFEDLGKNGTRGVCIEGGGEPTLYKDFKDVVLKAQECGLKLGLLTNGSIFNYEEVLDSFEFVRVSLDVATEEQMRTLKGFDSLETVLNNLEKMCKIRKDTTTIGAGYVLSNRNIDNLENIIIRLKEIGLDYIYIRPVCDHPELTAENFDASLYTKYNDEKFTVIVRGMEENAIIGNASLPCVSHSLTTIVTADGNVHLCGRLNIYKDWTPMGNLYKESFSEIWNGEERKRQAELVKNGEFCNKKCPACRLTKFNRFVADLEKTKTKDFI
jgi:radical SAM protein with 4Fe4S-binding SPASM domain